MTKKSQTILFFGTEDFSLASLEHLVRAGYPIAAVVTKKDTARGRGHKITAPAVKRFALSHNIPVWQPDSLDDIVNDIQALQQPVAGVLVSFGKIIPQRIIDLFSPGIINVHPSLLPMYRGPTPIESAIINGDTMTGVTIMQLSARMDAGPIYTQTTYPLNGTENQPEMYTELAQEGAKLLLTSLDGILAGKIPAVPQEESKAVYCSLLTKDQSILLPEETTAQQLERTIRAHLRFPRSKYQLDDGQLISITSAHVSKTTEHALSLPCNDGEYLTIDTLLSSNGKTMTADAFLNGYKK